MGSKTIKLTDKAFKRLGLLADYLGVLREVDLDNVDAQDWFVELLYEISKEQVDMAEAHRRHRRRMRSRGRIIES